MTFDLFTTAAAVLAEIPDVLALKAYAYETVLEKATEYFDGDVMAANVWISKYALKDSKGNIYEQTPDDMHWRIARELARVDANYPNPFTAEEFFQVMKRFKYIVPQGSPMAGIGNNFQFASLSNCFVIGLPGAADSYGGIMKIDEEQVQLMKRRGGVGHDLSHIRPSGSAVLNSALSSTGIQPFMERYSNSTREVAQDGRRGALMLTLSIKHPDSHLFIDAKKDLTKVTGANISIKIHDDFMNAVANEGEYKQQFPIDASYPMVEKTIDAKSLWNKIVHNAWASAEPGILFWDTVIKESVPDCYADQGFKTVSTNPCGEIPLCPYDSCRLLAINLYSYVDQPFTKEASFDFDLFRDHVSMAQRMMDNIIDLELEKIDAILGKLNGDPESANTRQTEVQLWEKIKEKCIQGRRTGIGITGEGDMLAALGLQYGSESGNAFSVNIHKELAIATYRGSVEMAKERGAFPLYRPEKEEKNPFIQRLAEADPELYQSMKRHGRRNIALLTIAPTGSTSILTQTSSGLEPVFRVSYQRRRKVNPNDRNVNISFTDEVGDSWEDYHVFHHAFEKWLDVNGYDVQKTKHLSEARLQEIIDQSPYYKATANDVDWLAKVELQGAVQKWVDHSISVTVNVPNEAPEELIGQIYMRAWQTGCKGITVYRDGSRTGVLISKEEPKHEHTVFTNHQSPKRPEVLDAKVLSFMNEKEKWVAVVGMYQDQPYEIFTGKADDSFSILTQVDEGKVIKRKGDDGKNRYDFQYIDKGGFKVSIEGLSRSFNPEYWNYAKLISGILRHGMPLEDVVDTVENLNMSDDNLNTWKNGVARVLRKLIPDGVVPAHKSCPSCAEETLVYQEGCLSCQSCGYSKCS